MSQPDDKNHDDKLVAELFTAVLQHNIGAVQLLLEQGVNVNAKNKEGLRCIYYAQNDPIMMQILVEAGAEKNYQDFSSPAAIEHAIANQYTEVIKSLLDAGIDCNKEGQYGETPLFFAIRYNRFEIVQLFIAAKMGVNYINKNQWTPLMYAANYGHTKIFKELLAAGADIKYRTKKDNLSALRLAEKSKHYEIADLLIAKGESILEMDSDDIANNRLNSKSCSTPPLQEAVLAGPRHIERIKLLLKAGADPNLRNSDKSWLELSPLLYAALQGFNEIVQLLLEANADINFCDRVDNTALIMATAGNGNGELIKMLIAAGAEVNWHNRYRHTPLISLVSTHNNKKFLNESPEQFQFLWEDVYGRKRSTKIASPADKLAMAQVLLEAHADIAPKGVDGKTALICASENGYEEIVKLLIHAGADITVKDNHSSTALTLASENGHNNVVKLLIHAGADVNAKDNQGKSALALAAENGHDETVKLLINSGADVNTKDNQGNTVLMQANSCSEMIINMLKDSGAQQPDYSSLSSANNRFAIKLFNKLIEQHLNQNIFISPLSIMFALSMAYLGADGETAQAMAHCLEIHNLTRTELKNAALTLKNVLDLSNDNANAKVKFSIANSLWANNSYKLKEEFTLEARDYFAAKVSTLNFYDANAPEIINDWVKQNTAGKITKIIDHTDSNMALYLINAIYFKGEWTKVFNSSQTQQAPFYLLNGDTKNCPLMFQHKRYRYLANDDLQAISLPYGDERISLYIFLPNKKDGLPEFYKTLTSQQWTKWMQAFTLKEGSILLPRFRLEYSITLNETLQALGMEIAFDSSRANFQKIYDLSNSNNICISEVKHKTFVDVNEEGTEAAAITSVEKTKGGSMVRPFYMKVDHPFCCAIVDNKTKAILFIGSIVEP